MTDMKDFRVLRESLDRFAGVTVVPTLDGGRKCGETGQLVSIAFAREIAETRLPRVLSFSNDIGQFLSFVVRAGRIVSLVAPTSTDFCPADSPVFNQVLTVESPELIADVARILSCFLTKATDISVRSQYVSGGGGHAEAGVLVETLLPDDSPMPGPNDRLATFVAATRDCVRSIVRAEGGGVTEQRGAPEELSVLNGLAASELAGQDAYEFDPDAQSCVILGHPSDDGMAVLCGAVGDALVFVTFAHSDCDVVLQAWYQSRRPAALGVV